MSPVLVFSLLTLCVAALAEKHYVEPEHLDMLRATGQDEEFARLLGVDVSLVKPQEGRTEEDFRFNRVSDLGDILLSPEQEEEDRQGMRFSTYRRYRWPRNEVPYVISSTDFTTRQRNFIVNSIAAFNSRSPRVKIVPRTAEEDYVEVISGSGCWSYLGRIGGAQPLSLQSNGCLSKATIQHEFIHALGFTHEHNRPDRDDHVKVLWDNIPEDWRSQYNLANNDYFMNVLAYDLLSVMHYPYYAPGTRNPAFEVYDSSFNPHLLGRSEEATDLDIQKVDVLYS